MRIAQIAPIVLPLPPKKYGGAERVVHALTEELVRRGHDVTLFASGDSNTSAKLASVYPTTIHKSNIKDPFGFNELSLLHIGFAYQQQDKFDVIHDHAIPMSVPTASIAQTPTVLTMHKPFTDTRATHLLYENLRNLNLVTISHAQARFLNDKNANILGTVYNGLDMKHYPFGKAPGRYLLFVGRIAERKGAHLAIEAAERLDLPLILTGAYNACDDPDGSYFNRRIKPHLGANTIWIGEVGEEERNKLMSHALCVLHPVTWPEPFGLSMIESMACGAPVVGFNKGSIPEVIKSGVSGYVVETLDEMVEAVKQVSVISRTNCRMYALETFSAEKMADGYEEMYKLAIERNQSKDLAWRSRRVQESAQAVRRTQLVSHTKRLF